MSFTYLASPYSHPKREMLEVRYLEALRACAALYNAGCTVFSPIVHCHEMAKVHILPTSFDFWLPHNHAMLEASEALLILNITGWVESVGLRSEALRAEELGIITAFVNVEGVISPYVKPELWELDQGVSSVHGAQRSS